jgi:hypothetical protein
MSPQSSDTPVIDKKTETYDLLKDEVKEQETIELPKEKKEEEKPEEEEEEVPAKREEEEEEEEDELKEIEEELEEPTEDKLELVTPVRRREILAKYPQLFKDFPYLEKAYYREQQFTEVFPTITDAKEAAEKAEVLDKYEVDIMKGNIGVVLNAVKEESDDAFSELVDNLLPALQKTDQNAYYHVMGNVIKQTIYSMWQEGNQSNNDVLKNAAQIVNQYVFGSNTFVPPSNLSAKKQPQETEREQELQERERTYITERFESARDDLQTRADNTLKATIEQNVDPKKTMTDYVRKNAVREAHEILVNLIDKDSRFGNILDRLWEKAFERNFDKQSMDSIKSAYFTKAKTLLPSVIKKARLDALRGMGKRVREDEEETSTPANKGPVTPGRPLSKGKITSAKEIPKGMTSLEFLNQD